MSSMVACPEMVVAIDAVSAGLDALFEVGVDPVDARDAVTCIRELEQLRRRVDAAQNGLLTAIEDRGLYRGDGHGSAKIMVRHVANLSDGEAATRHKVARMTHDLPDVRDEYVAGRIGTDHIRTLSRIHANPRVRHHMADRQTTLLSQARRPHRDFERLVRRWEQTTDDNGPTPATERSHHTRDVSLTQDFDMSWTLDGGYASMQGATMREILDHYINAELLADWEKARAEHGDTACAQHLPRTGGQRRADALWQLFQDAATNPNGAVPVSYIHNINWTAEAFEEHLSRTLGADPQPVDPDRYQCETLDGTPLDPTEAIASALVSKVRRVILNTNGTVIDLGTARFFTGNARDAIKLQNTECVWPGCHTPSTACETDHLTEHSQHGRTNPGNGAPTCAKHNRWKQKHFTTWRDPTGQWHTTRPDGTKI